MMYPVEYVSHREMKYRPAVNANQTIASTTAHVVVRIAETLFGAYNTSHMLMGCDRWCNRFWKLLRVRSTLVPNTISTDRVEVSLLVPVSILWQDEKGDVLLYTSSNARFGHCHSRSFRFV